MDLKRAIEEYALSFLLKPYAWGGDDFSGVDCSGLTFEIMLAAGVIPSGVKDMNAQSQWDYFKKLPGRPIDFGSLLFWGKSLTGITHVALALNSTHYLGAEGGGSAIKTEEDAKKNNAFVKIRPIAYRGKPIAVAHPPYPWS